MALKWYIVHVYSGFESKVKFALEEKIASSPYPKKFVAWHEPKDEIQEYAFCIARTASLIDAWEVGVTTPSAWMNHWHAYRKRSLGLIEGQSDRIALKADEACNLLAEKDNEGYFVIQPLRLTG